jgi:hypothetical protein
MRALPRPHGVDNCGIDHWSAYRSHAPRGDHNIARGCVARYPCIYVNRDISDPPGHEFVLSRIAGHPGHTQDLRIACERTGATVQPLYLEAKAVVVAAAAAMFAGRPYPFVKDDGHH